MHIQLYEVKNLFPVVHTFLSVILWGTPLSFDWNLLLFLLLLPGLFFVFLLSLSFYEFIITHKNDLSTYFLKKNIIF